MKQADALDRLLVLHGEIARLAAEHRRLCETTAPDAVALGRVRWRIAEVGRHRMELLTTTVFPMVECGCVGSERNAVEALRASTTGYRSEVSRYVSRWSTSAIVADWATYRRETKGFRRQVAGRLALERELLVPLLRRRAV